MKRGGMEGGMRKGMRSGSCDLQNMKDGKIWEGVGLEEWGVFAGRIKEMALDGFWLGKLVVGDVLL